MSRYPPSSSNRFDDHNRYNGDTRASSFSNSNGDAHQFSLSESDFQRDAVLKRRRYLSPPAKSAPSSGSNNDTSRSSHRQASSKSERYSANPSPPSRVWTSIGTRPYHPTPSSAPSGPSPAAIAKVAAATKAAARPTAVSAPAEPIAARVRSKSKSRAKKLPVKKPASTEFVPLGQPQQTRNPYKATYHGSEKYRSVRSRSRSVGPRDEEPRGRTRERAREWELEREREALPEPKATLSKSRSSRSDAAQEKATRSKSTTRSHRSKESRRSRSPSSRRERKRSKSAHRKASAKRTSPSPSSSPPPRRESERRRSKSTSRRSEKGEKSRGKSRARSVAPSRPVRSDIDDEIKTTKQGLKSAKHELQELQDELAELTERIESKAHQIKHMELDLEVLEKRKQIDREHRKSAYSTPAPQPIPESNSDRRRRSVSRARASSKRPCIVDTDESGEDDEVVILDPVKVKEEKSLKRQRSSSRARTATSRNASPASAKPSQSTAHAPADTSLSENINRSYSSTEIPDHFWGKADTPKLLVQHRVRTIPDGSARKGRHLAFNPMKPDIFATSSDDGGLILWNYERPNHEISKLVSFAPNSFRNDNQCAESLVWSPDGNRMAMGFRDPMDGMGEFCVVRLHQLELTDSNKPQKIPSDRVTSKTTTLHSRGISAIEWIPTGHGSGLTSHSLVTAGSDHAVVLWKEDDDMKSGRDYTWKVLHREHRSEVKTICVHSQRQAIFTGGFDGQVIRYDMGKFLPHTVMERRKPTISKINAVLEHPHNPNILLVSSVEQSEHSILLHDLRERYISSRNSTMTLSWVKSSDAKSMSQYIVPRWSPAGMHVSCGSKSGLVNIWDVRVRGSSYPVVLPQQSITVHRKYLYTYRFTAELCALTRLCVLLPSCLQRKRCCTQRGIRDTMRSSVCRTTALLVC